VKSAAQFSHLLFQFPKAIPQGGNLCQAPGGYTGVGSLTLERVIQLASGSRTMFPFIIPFLAHGRYLLGAAFMKKAGPPGTTAEVDPVRWTA